MTAVPPPYTDASQARLTTSYEAYELSELARLAVPVDGYELCHDGTTGSPGTVLADALRALAAAHRLLEAAAVFERLAGADLRLVLDALEAAAEAARERCAAAGARLREEPLSPGGPGTTVAPHGASGWRAYASVNPLEAALDLDDWVLRHADGEHGLGPAPVSGGLVRKRPPGPAGS